MGLFNGRLLRSERKSSDVTTTSASSIASILEQIMADGSISSSYSSQLSDGYAANPYVARCVDLRASAVASLTPILLDSDDNEITGPHPLRDLLKRPNSRYSWKRLIFQTEADLCLNGNGYIQAIQTVKGPTELWNLPAGDMTPQTQTDYYNPLAYWQVTGNGASTRMEPSDVIHFIEGVIGPDRIRGISPLESAGLSVMQQTEARRWNVALMRNGAKPSIVIVDPNVMDPYTYKEFSERLQQNHGGPEQAGKTMVLDGGKTISSAGFNARDMDYAVGVTTSAKEIAIAMRVPPELIGDSANKTYSNAMEANKEFATHTVMPEADMIYEALSARLCPYYSDVARISYDESEIDALRGDESTIITALTACDFMTTNEKRARMSYDSVDGGDSVLTPMGKVPLKEVSTPIEELVDAPDPYSE